MAGRLTARDTLGLLREVSRILRAGGEPVEAVRRAGQALVPVAADRVRVHAVDADGRLRVLDGAGVEGPGCGAEEGPGFPGAADSPGDPPADRESDRPAVVAFRRGEPVLVVRDGTRDRVVTEPPDGHAPIVGIALPLARNGETVGVLELALDPDGLRPFERGDLDGVGLIGDRISLALENLRLRREIEAARRAKSDFLSVVSHELRTPLTAIVGYADLMAAGIPGPVTERQARQLGRIKENAWDLLELIDGILGYARHEGEGRDVLLSLVRPARIVEEALAAVQTEVRDKGLALTVDVAEELPALRTDREKAVWILRHLVSNAAKFTEQGAVTVRVARGPDGVDFTVGDTGPGLRPAEQGLAFEPFWQGERAETRTKGGTGLGLSMARRLATILSGDILVESEVGRGSTFVLRLPREGPRASFP